MSSFVFPVRTTTAEIELGTTLQPKFGADGLIPCITQDAATGEVLMFAFMNAESLAHTLKTRKATYWSRSRNKLWVKVDQTGAGGAACHNGYKSCFYRKVAANAKAVDAAPPKLEFAAQRLFDPATVYKKK